MVFGHGSPKLFCLSHLLTYHMAAGYYSVGQLKLYHRSFLLATVDCII